jgi:phosphoribosylformimino-5-aminoimidazole carboxamide ribotide isomerase
MPGGFSVWPALDLMGGKAVRLLQGEPSSAWVVSDDPLSLAQSWVAAGAPGLHLVDLDAALGQGDNRRLISELIQVLPVPVQVGGGVRSAEAFWELRRLRACRVVVGSLAVRQPEVVAQLAQEDPEGLMVAADVREGRVALAGWREASAHSLPAFAQRMRQLGVRHLLVTAVERDGTGAGPSVELLRQALEAFGPGVWASGGVGSGEHLQALQGLAPMGLAGVVVGAALARGQLRLEDLRPFWEV